MELDYKAISHADRKQPPAYLLWAIIVTLLLCQVLGIVAILYSIQVKRRWEAGDHIGAKEASRMTRIWIFFAAIIGIILLAICFFVVQFYVIGGDSGL